MRAKTSTSQNDTLAAFGSTATRSRASTWHVLVAVVLTVVTPLVVLAALSTPVVAMAAAAGALVVGLAMHVRR